MKDFVTYLFVLFSLTAFGQNKAMKVNKNAIQLLTAFKSKPKFERGASYTGLGMPALKPKLSVIINQAADDFIQTCKNSPTEKKFQEDIKTGLSRFSNVYNDLDTEDRELICYYFENLMDCVGLESSGGQLNMWIYGFDPTKKG